jgi:hypothetical protein
MADTPNMTDTPTTTPATSGILGDQIATGDIKPTSAEIAEVRAKICENPNLLGEVYEKAVGDSQKHCAKAILTTLCHVLEDEYARANSTGLRACIDEIKALVPHKPDCNICMYMDKVGGGARPEKYKLHVSLVPVDKAYQTKIMVPTDDHAKELYKIYDYIKCLSLVFWRNFVQTHEELVARLRKCLPAFDGAALTVDKASPTTMYFLPELAHRVGILCFYSDERDNVLRSK